MLEDILVYMVEDILVLCGLPCCKDVVCWRIYWCILCYVACLAVRMWYVGGYTGVHS